METLYSWEEVAKSIGVTVEELTTMAFKDGLIDENGLPTQKALDEELLQLQMEVHIPSTAEEKRKAIIFAELRNYKKKQSVSESFVLSRIENWQKMSEREIEDWYKKDF